MTVQLRQDLIHDHAKWEPMQNWITAETQQVLLLHMDAAYRQVSDERIGRMKMWMIVMGQVRTVITSAIESQGFETAPMYWDSFLDRIAPDSALDQGEHMRLIKALTREYTTRVQDHIRYRIQHEGNVHFEFIGRTGSGKSSCALTVANWMYPIAPENISRHINLDFGQVSQKLRLLQRGQCLVQDELLALVGENARTTQLQLENTMDTLRQSGVSLLTCSPESRELTTMQAGFEAIAWNTDTKKTLFLVHVDGKPMGVTAIPWVKGELWQHYKIFKEDALGEFMAYVAQNFARLEKEYETVFFTLPSEGLKRVALKCYKE